MKPAVKGIRWSRIAIWFFAILAFGWLVWQNRTRTSYGAVCALCLLGAHGLELKGGGVVGCGQFAEGRAFRLRLEVLDAALRTFERIPERELGKAALAILDRIFPADATVREANRLSGDFKVSVRKPEAMTLLLSVVETPAEWRMALDHFEGGFQGDAPMISDAGFIESRARSADALVRRGCVAVISRTDTTASSELLAALLDDPDDGVSREAGDKVFYSNQFALFAKLFRRQRPDSHRLETMAKYSDSDFGKLLALDDPVVGDVCFEAIGKGRRLSLPDQVVSRLNHRDSEAGRKAVERLIRGPGLMKVGDGTYSPMGE
jgi:hypothetical protein